ncbi:MAG TPA: hypothetical protein VHP32_10595 [Ignavibacteria bacterium]|nr:hypothetical protein [Ignavibacteria bacterium]
MKKFILSALLFIGILFAATAAANAQDADASTGTVETRDYAIINNTGTTIHSIYFSPANMEKYGDDILVPGVSILTTNNYAYRWMDFPVAECLWDIKYTTIDGTDYVVNNVDLCQSRTITFYGLTK